MLNLTLLGLFLVCMYVWLFLFFFFFLLVFVVGVLKVEFAYSQKVYFLIIKTSVYSFHWTTGKKSWTCLLLKHSWLIVGFRCQLFLKRFQFQNECKTEDDMCITCYRLEHLNYPHLTLLLITTLTLAHIHYFFNQT